MGSNMIDSTSFLKRFPKKGETVYGKEYVQGFGGKGSNQAIMASLLGADVTMVTALGDDENGENYLNHYRSENIATDYVRVVKENHSGVAAIWVEPDGNNRIVISSGANEDLTPEFIDESFDDLSDTNIVLSQLENPQKSILAGFKRGREQGAITILNPAPAEVLLDEILEYTDWLLPNETEFAFLAKEMYGITNENPKEAMKKFAEQSETNMVVTMGEKGALLYMPQKDMNVEQIATIPVEVKDTTGAGDAFCGTFAYGLANNLQPAKAIELANIIASDSVQKNGTQTSYAKGDFLEKLKEQVLSQK